MKMLIVAGCFFVTGAGVVLTLLYPALGLLTVALAFGIIAGCCAAGLLWALAKVGYLRAESQSLLLNAEAARLAKLSKLVEASKVHADNSAIIIPASMAGSQVVQLSPTINASAGLAYGSISAWRVTSFGAAPAIVNSVPAMSMPNVPTFGAVATAASPVPNSANFADHVKGSMFEDGDLNLTLGVSNQGVVREKLTNLTHMLPAGKTKSGKSTFLRALAGQAILAELEAPGSVRMCFIDCSTITFNDNLFRGSSMMLGRVPEVITEETDAPQVILSLLAECQHRSKLYAKAPGYPESLPDYNAVTTPENRLPAVLCFIEEMSALAESIKDPFISPLKRLIWTGRKFGIYLICAGQDFRAKTIDKTIVGNASSRFAFRQTSPETLRVLEIETAQRISADQPGRGLMYLNGRIDEIQGLFLPKPDFVSLVQSTKRPNQVVEPVEPEPEEPDLVERARRLVRELPSKASVKSLEIGLGISHRQAYKIYQQFQQEGLI